MSEFGGVRRVLSAFFDAEIDVFKGYRGKIFAIAINRFVNFVVIGNFVIPYGRFFGFAVDAFGGRAVDAAAAGKDTAVFVFGVAAGAFAAGKMLPSLEEEAAVSGLKKLLALPAAAAFPQAEKVPQSRTAKKRKDLTAC